MEIFQVIVNISEISIEIAFCLYKLIKMILSFGLEIEPFDVVLLISSHFNQPN